MARNINVTTEIQAILQACTVLEDRVVLPAGQLDRRLYAAVNRVLAHLGGQWNRQAQAHLFAGHPQDALTQVLATGSMTVQPSPQQQFQEFWTPEWLADQMVEVAGVQPGNAVCDPSAGTGRLLDAVLRVPGFREHLGSLLVGYELQPARAHALEEKYGPHVLVWRGDFLEHHSPAQHERMAYHVILMNPPYAKNQAIAHVTHALGWLEGGGRLVAVLPDSVQWRNGKAIEGFRTILEQYDHTITPLPDDTFKASGTLVKTVLLHCVRPEQPGMHARDVMTNVARAVQESCKEPEDRKRSGPAPPRSLALPQSDAGAQLSLF